MMPDVSTDEVRVESVDTAPVVGPVASIVLRDGTRRRVQLLESVELLWLGNLWGVPQPGAGA